ncbi:MAG: endo-1,4-beta-xylanase [Clostridia bacterium]|nr:endo-1,4-beta-xylanase [Clostridia bacterium]
MYHEEDFLRSFKKYDAYTQDKIALGIEQNRKGWGEITVTDREGRAVPGAKITLTQTSHEFKYGCNLFMLDQLETDEKNRLYKAYVKGIANMVTLPFYWNATEPEEGKTRYAADSEPMYRRPPIDLCMRFCEENGIEPREHGLAYPYFFPRWLQNASEYEIKKHFVKRCKEIAARYGDRINCIEVVNEMFWGANRFFKFYSDPDFVTWCFRTARTYFPYHKLAINESIKTWVDEKMKRAYFEMIRNAQNAGAMIDAVGLHYHMFFKADVAKKETAKYYDPKNLYDTMDRYARLGLPLQVSEVTIPAYSENEQDEALQAEILARVLRIWFSHPAVEQIIYWNLVDGYAHGAAPGDMAAGENYYYGGLLRFDMTPKPAYFVFKNLFEKEWRTTAAAVTDGDGFALFKGFYGDYTVRIEANGKMTEKQIRLGKRLLNTYKLEV